MKKIKYKKYKLSKGRGLYKNLNYISFSRFEAILKKNIPIKNNFNGWGIEIKKDKALSVIDFFYYGQFVKGKRNGYGEEYNYHPGLGVLYEPSIEETKIQVAKATTDISYYYKGLWKDNLKHGLGNVFQGNGIDYKVYNGEFKKGKLYEGEIKCFPVMSLNTKNFIDITSIKSGKIYKKKKFKGKKARIEIEYELNLASKNLP